ncbi:MAG: hypothetical protein Q8O19_03450, partial [Rectinemataceae bacterium]|nr:hypothetical protein [Rectinemataceae bacterium]
EGCNFKCKYCAFEALQHRFGITDEDRAYKPHIHLERLDKKPRSTSGDEFVTIGLNGDISFASDEVIEQIIAYCTRWSDRTFLIQSKNPARFIETDGTGTRKFKFPENVILGCTLETNYSLIPSAPAPGEYVPYNTISKAPDTVIRAEAMIEIQDNRKIITIEPILNFHPETMKYMIEAINPIAVYIGYDSGRHKLPEPPLQKTLEFIESIEPITQVRQKLIRPAWFEQSARTDA